MYNNKYVQKHAEDNLEDLFTYVNVDIEKLSQKRKDEWGLDEEYCNTLTLADAYKLVEWGELDYIDYDSCYFDDIEYKDYLSELVKKAEHYLVYLPNSTWNGASGCGIVNSLEKAFYRDYDHHQYVKAVTKGNKAILLRETHHDVPCGHNVVIVALTEKEYNMLDNSDFETMEKFALDYLNNLIPLQENTRDKIKSLI